MAESGDELRNRADDVLSDPKYGSSEPGLIDRAIQEVRDLLGDLFGFITSRSAFGSVAVGWILLALMLALIVWLLWRYMPRFRMLPTQRIEAVVSTKRNRRTRAEWLADATEAERNGQHREAVRARYKATVAGLVEHDELPDGPGMTASELVTAFEAEQRRADPFASSTGVFSDVWYGGSEADRSDSQRVADWDAEVVTEKSAR